MNKSSTVGLNKKQTETDIYVSLHATKKHFCNIHFQKILFWKTKVKINICCFFLLQIFQTHIIKIYVFFQPNSFRGCICLLINYDFSMWLKKVFPVALSTNEFLWVCKGNNSFVISHSWRHFQFSFYFPLVLLNVIP